MRPLNKKLKKCRDPDRFDLVALQKARREQAQQKPKAKVPAKADGDVFGTSNGMIKDEERDAKRRRVAGGADMFGPPL
jgi:cyclin H